MKELKFTPGPWNFDQNSEDFDDSTRDAFNIMANGIRNWVADAKYGHGGINIDKETGKGNAILISKAPEMYSALLKAREAIMELYEWADKVRDVRSIDSMKIAQQSLYEINKILES